MSMDEIVPNLWVGDLPSALNTETLRTHNIRSVLTAMRGRVSIHEVRRSMLLWWASSRHTAEQTFIRHQINLDDTEDADILQHFVPSIAFIQAELDKGWGVLVHCQAGMSTCCPNISPFLPNRTLDHRSKRRHRHGVPNGYTSFGCRGCSRDHQEGTSRCTVRILFLCESMLARYISLGSVREHTITLFIVDQTKDSCANWKFSTKHRSEYPSGTRRRVSSTLNAW